MTSVGVPPRSDRLRPGPVRPSKGGRLNSGAGLPTRAEGRVAIDWGVYGVPETFVIDKDGRIAYRHVGPLQPRDLTETILPLLERLR